jgi:hypothetical protein
MMMERKGVSLILFFTKVNKSSNSFSSNPDCNGILFCSFWSKKDSVESGKMELKEAQKFRFFL